MASNPAGPVARPTATASPRRWWVGIGLSVVVAVVVAAVVHLVADEPVNSGFADGAAVLAFVTAIAVGVERVIELVWGRVDGAADKGAWWPLSIVTDTLREVETATDRVLTPFTGDVTSLLQELEGWTGSKQARVAAVDSVSEQIEERAAAARQAIDNARRLAPGSSRFAAIARATDDFAHDAELIARRAGVWSRDLERHLRAAGDVLSNAQDVVGAFRANPARRAMSIALGVPLAILASGILGLNMFSAVLGPDVPGYMAGLAGILATGVVMGLGSNPTHEVIKALQRRRGDATVDVPVGSSVQVVGTTVPVMIPTPSPTAGAADWRADEETDESMAAGATDPSHTVERSAATAGAGTPSTPVGMVRTTFVSNRQARPIRNAG